MLDYAQPKKHLLEKVGRCWIWCGASRGRKGNEYGVLSVRGKVMSVHRLSYLIKFGFIEGGKDVLHSCDNTKCFNPSHLSLGYAKDNARDMVRKFRQNCQKLKARDYVKIRLMYKSGNFSHREIGQKFGVANSQISRIVNNLTVL